MIPLAFPFVFLFRLIVLFCFFFDLPLVDYEELRARFCPRDS